MKNFGVGLAIFLVVLALGGIYGLLAQNKPEASEEDKRKIWIGEQLFLAELADTAVKRNSGLSGRASLPENQGLLFVFSQAGSYEFWMKGMQFPLDIIWIGNDQVVGIEKNIPANSMNTYYPPQPVDKVLEINAGLSDKLGIQAGDSVEFNY